MPALVSLAHMELNGFGFSEDECERQRKIIVARLEELEQEAYRLAGRTFALTSPEDVCQVCFFSNFLIKERVVKVISVSDNLISDHNSAYS
jgi:DNA polymerase I-like protein with 3'-5' exonuclease and polymerase domains